MVWEREVQGSAGVKQRPPDHFGVGQEGYPVAAAAGKGEKEFAGRQGGYLAFHAEGLAQTRTWRCERSTVAGVQGRRSAGAECGGP